MNLEQMKKIVEGAPSWAKYWITQGEYHYSVLSFPNMSGNSSYDLDDLRAELAKHDTLDLEPSDITHGCVVVEK